MRLLGLVLLGISSTALAQSAPLSCFRSAREALGERFNVGDSALAVLCRGSESTQASVGCFRNVMERVELSHEEIATLCSRTPSASEPLRCFMAATSRLGGRDGLVAGQIVRLCSGAESWEGPIKCYTGAVSSLGNELSEETRVTLCSGAR